ncbi:hypothetical protein NHX12_012334 [Muraenolepis orangiensis]|uniref:Uncharacterized protein n=1 Tax=Muraenolepis orangiensis TaxID=630683 RepID=A0A9Q0I3X8_9TELE|nr:hypothetical protein NHX12_012334 [Muraenolepis orangiensis]
MAGLRARLSSVVSDGVSHQSPMLLPVPGYRYRALMEATGRDSRTGGCVRVGTTASSPSPSVRTQLSRHRLLPSSLRPLSSESPRPFSSESPPLPVEAHWDLAVGAEYGFTYLKV